MSIPRWAGRPFEVDRWSVRLLWFRVLLAILGLVLALSLGDRKARETRLTVAVPEARAQGLMIEARDARGVPIAGAELALIPDDGRRRPRIGDPETWEKHRIPGVTDTRGRLQICRPGGSGEKRVLFARAGLRQGFCYLQPGAVRIGVELRDAEDPRPGYGALVGRVLCQGKPVAFPQLEMRSTERSEPLLAQSDAEGRFAFHDLAEGEYDLFIRADGCAWRDIDRAIFGHGINRRDLNLDPEAVIEGALTLPEGLDPSSVEVKASSHHSRGCGGSRSHRGQILDVDRYRIPQLAAAESYSVSVVAPGYSNTYDRVRVSEGGLVRGPALSLRGQSLITGRLIDPDGRPLSRARIGLRPREKGRWSHSETNAQGGFRLHASDGDYHLFVVWRDAVIDVAKLVVAGRYQELGERVPEGYSKLASLTITVLDAGGRLCPPEQVTLELTHRGRRVETEMVGDSFRVPLLSMLTDYEARAWSRTHISESLELELKPGESRHVRLVLSQRSGRIRGRILGSPRWLARFPEVRLNGRAVQADATGRFRFEDLNPGPKFLTAGLIRRHLTLGALFESEIELASGADQVLEVKVEDVLARVEVEVPGWAGGGPAEVSLSRSRSPTALVRDGACLLWAQPRLGLDLKVQLFAGMREPESGGQWVSWELPLSGGLVGGQARKVRFDFSGLKSEVSGSVRYKGYGEVWLTRGDGLDIVADLHEDMSFRFRHVPPGRYTLNWPVARGRRARLGLVLSGGEVLDLGDLPRSDPD